MALYELVIKNELPDLNAYINACRMNKYAGAKMKEDAQNLIKGYILETDNLPPKKIEYAETVEFLWIAKDKRKDKDNIAFAKKFIFDALVDCGVLAGDGWRNIGNFYDRFVLAKKDNGKNNKAKTLNIEDAVLDIGVIVKIWYTK